MTSKAGLRLAFMGTPEFAVPALAALVRSSHQVVAVYTQPPRPKGRGHQIQKSPVHDLAEQHGIPVYTPSSLKKSPEVQAEFAALNLDVAVVAAYGLILPKAVLAAPRYGCLNLHASLLPRWRGASPIHHAIWRGDPETGMTIMQMDEGLDTGAMIAKETVPITAETTLPSLHDRLAAMGAGMIVQLLDELAQQGQLPATPQPAEGSTYAPLLKKEDGFIDWNQAADTIDAQIRALNPWPGTYTVLPDGRPLKILQAVVVADLSTSPPGTVLDRTGHTVCGGGSVLKILEVQAPTGKKMSFADLINGGLIKPGAQYRPRAVAPEVGPDRQS